MLNDDVVQIFNTKSIVGGLTPSATAGTHIMMLAEILLVYGEVVIRQVGKTLIIYR